MTEHADYSGTRTPLGNNNLSLLARCPHLRGLFVYAKITSQQQQLGLQLKTRTEESTLCMEVCVVVVNMFRCTYSLFSSRQRHSLDSN